MTKIESIKCCSHRSDSVVICHLKTLTSRSTPIKHVRACRIKRDSHTPDTSPWLDRRPSR